MAKSSKSSRDGQGAKVDKVDVFLAALTPESEFFGLIGEGYPTSLFKVYVRAKRTSSRWWKFGVNAAPVKRDPIKYQAKMQVSARAPAVWAPLAHLPHYQHPPQKAAIAKLLARVADLQQPQA